MRNHPWRRLLLFGSHYQSQQLHISRNFYIQLHAHLSGPTPIRHFSSLLVSRSLFVSEIRDLRSPRFRCFSSSELAIEDKDSDHVAVLTDIFSKHPAIVDEIKLELDSSNVVITHELVLKVLQSLGTAPDVARTFFDWVSKSEGERLSSKSYNLMLRILGSNGHVKEFWDLVEIMKTKGYGVSKGTHTMVLEKFEKEGLDADLDKLKELYTSGSVDNSVEKVCSRVCKVIRRQVWGDDVEKCLRELKIEYSSDLVVMVLRNLGTEPNKAMMFFRWVHESNLFEHDERSFNAMARVLGREDCIEELWKVLDELRGAGFEMEMETYIEILGSFVKRNMIKDAVNLYEFGMTSANRPTVRDCTFLLRKVATSRELDVNLFLRVVKAFTEGGDMLPSLTIDAVIKSLTSVGRFGECNRILKAMEKSGFLPSDILQSKIAFWLSSNRKAEEASEFLDNMEASRGNLSYKTWISLVEGHCVAGDLDEAADCFQRMVQKEGVSSAGYALELLVKAYCVRSRAIDVCKLLTDMVNEKELKPSHRAYKVLINKLLVQSGFKEALSLLGLMKSQGYPPYLDPFVEYVSKIGTAEEAMMFLQAITVKRFPSTAVFLRVFEAYLNAGRHDEAQNLLSICPGYIRNHADVLNLFFIMKLKPAEAASVAA
ncbi:pentatricopeptide repeat-containing protein At3g02490, mitochondrial-like [Diospyros lotus]|uniref:pentatricopeptide repeat-containing protein At3g02490, mitochondrial-like n=1 Tax=Diospyros lotus TaxID=55363 RepID=UPI0022561619|nr:pentatricopeptide repeat-containing protein At3g02490, mitochondrial-like [Diospyros lotus]XP_052197882.1 pentatricopeptide repeat-containing protein At3g02490, mitochondrial-like [Diospyros lotus]XP_052197884.1 pentatricopeptide repeat-containing protein At3g02490, mitochondrial-like [Diospyros lotus]